jgi:hypothetical protein
MDGWRRLSAVVVVVALAGCGTTPVAQDIAVDETVDLDCDGRISEVTATATVSARGSASDLYAVVAYEAANGERRRIDRFDVGSDASHRVTVDTDDIDAGESTRLHVVVRRDGFLSDETLGAASTRRLDVESPDADRPAAEPTVSVDPAIPEPGESAAFAVDRTAEEGCPLDAVRWDFTGDGTADANGTDVTHTFTRDGYHEVTVSVVTSSGVEFETTETVLVTADEGVKFRDAVDPMPRSVLFPQGVVQAVLALVISLAVVASIRRR